MTEISGYAADVLTELQKAYHFWDEKNWTRGEPIELDLLFQRLAWDPERKGESFAGALVELYYAGYIFAKDGVGEEMFRPEVPEPETKPHQDVRAFEKFKERLEDLQVRSVTYDLPDGFFDLPSDKPPLKIPASQMVTSVAPSESVKVITLTGESELELVGRQGSALFFAPKRPSYLHYVLGSTAHSTPEQTLASCYIFEPLTPAVSAEQAAEWAESADYLLGRWEKAAPPARPSFDTLGMQTAQLWATRSSDEKLKVGAALLDRYHRVIGVGYNGRAAGEPNTRESLAQGMSGALHAEINLLLAANWNGEGSTLYVTAEPCANCARAIINSRRVSKVFYGEPYYEEARKNLGLPRGSEILSEAGVEVSQWTN